MNSLKNIFFTLAVTLCTTACKTSIDHDYVDLGLPSGTLWATYNVGASAPTEAGELFAWGETEPKCTYYWADYCLSSDENHMTKYCLNPKEGNVDSLTVLAEDDDAATANWGKDWRMPSAEEMAELIKGCAWKWTNNYAGWGLSGMVGTSLYNKKQIFLPATEMRKGKYDGKDIYVAYHLNTETIKDYKAILNTGHYFSRNLYPSHSTYGVSMNFEKDRSPYIAVEERMMGCNIRAVRCKKVNIEKKECNTFFKDTTALAAENVADFNVVGNYEKQSLTISGYFNCKTDWTYNYIDTLVYDSVLHMMVRGTDTKKHKTDSLHKSAYFKKEYKITPGIKRVVFGPTLETIWQRTYPDYNYKLNGTPVAKMIRIVESTDLCPQFPRTFYDIKTADEKREERCRDTSAFSSLIPSGYIYNGIFSTCDVNKDGKTDYLLNLEGPYEQGNYPKDKEEDGGYDRPFHANRGIMLVINEGDTSYVSDIWNSGCFSPVDEDGGAYYAPELSVDGNKDTLKIHYSHGRYGCWSFKFVYRDGDYQLTESEENGSDGPTLVWWKCIDLENGYEWVNQLKTSFPYNLKEEPSEESYNFTKFAIKRHGKYTLTNMRSFYNVYDMYD